MIQKTGLSAHRRLKQVTPLTWTGENRAKTQISHLKHWENLKLEYNLHYPETETIQCCPILYNCFTHS